MKNQARPLVVEKSVGTLSFFEGTPEAYRVVLGKMWNGWTIENSFVMTLIGLNCHKINLLT